MSCMTISALTSRGPQVHSARLIENDWADGTNRLLLLKARRVQAEGRGEVVVNSMPVGGRSRSEGWHGQWLQRSWLTMPSTESEVQTNGTSRFRRKIMVIRLCATEDGVQLL